MSRFTIPSALIALFMSTAAFANSADKVMDIKINVGLSAISDQGAAARYSHLDLDLKEALAERLVGRIADDGFKIDINIIQLMMDTNPATMSSDQKARLVGKVYFNDHGDSAKVVPVGLVVSLGPTAVPVTLMAVRSDDLVVPLNYAVLEVANPDAIYHSLVAGFADAVIDHLNK